MAIGVFIAPILLYLEAYLQARRICKAFPAQSPALGIDDIASGPRSLPDQE
jgi:hypothetical protein